MSEQRELRAFRATAVVTVMSYAAQVLSLAAIPVYLSTIGAESYGLMVTVMAFMGHLNFADAGLSWGSLILIAHAHGRKAPAEIAHVVRHSAVLALGSGAVVGVAIVTLLVAAAAGWRLPMFSANPSADRLLVIAGIQLFVTLQLGVVYNVYQGLQEGYWGALYQGAARLLGLGAGMWAAWKYRDVGAVMIVQLLLTLAAGVAAFVHLRQRHPWAFVAGSISDRQQYGTQLAVGSKNFLLQIGRTLAASAPTLAISSVLGPAIVPFYTVPLTLLSSIFIPVNAWGALMQSAYGAAWASGDHEWIRNAFRQSFERVLLIGSAGIGLFVGMSDRFVSLWTHGRLSVAPATAISIATIVLLGATLGLGQYLLTAVNRNGRVAVAEIINGILATLLVPLGVWQWGLGGVGVGVLGAALCTSVWVLVREISANLGRGWSPPLAFVLRVTLAGVAGGFAVRSIESVWTTQNFPLAMLWLGVSCLGGLVAFVGFAAALRLPVVAEISELPRRLRAALNPS